MPQVKMPDGALVDMPDNLTPELATRLKAFRDTPSTPAPQQQPPGMMQRLGQAASQFGTDAMRVGVPGAVLKAGGRALGDPAQIPRQLGLSARAGLQGLVSPVTATADAIGGAANYFLPPGYKVPSYSEQFSKGLTEVGLPEAQSKTEKGVGLAAELIGGAAATPSGMVRGAQRIATPAIRSASEGLMQRALKPTYDELKKGHADVAIKTMLDEGYPLSAKGMSQIKDRITGFNAMVDNAIAKSQKSIPVDDIKAFVSERLREAQAMPMSYRKQIEDEAVDFLKHPMIAGKTQIPIQDAQSLKKGFQSVLDKKYGQPGTGADEAQKAIASALREHVGRGETQVIPWNKEEQKLIRTLNVAQRRVLMEGNKNPQGFSSMMIEKPFTWANMMLDRSGVFRAFAARILNKGKEAIPEAAARTAMGVTAAVDQPKPPTGQT